ncbi:alpha/beta hydrolase [Streptomyces sp. NPDC006333]|uniref:alpha/beta hydrolase n=1 Tax=Streptomyces sp. NPDC006333 TaxID=3156753 RepID=UPI0033A69051
MSLIVGVHGIARQQLGRGQLTASWKPALGDCIERACGHPVRDVPLDIAFYGHLFLAPLNDTPPAKGGLAVDEWWHDLDPAAIADLEEVARQVLPVGAVEEAEARPSKTRTRMPAFLRAIDQRFPAGGVLAFGDLIQVRRYLLDPGVKHRVDAAVDAAVTQDCRVLIAHSLGSVVAFEYLRRHPGSRFETLVTLGSPLGLRLVQKLVPNPAYGIAFGIPPQLRAWINVRDRRDPVACAGPLGQWWPGVKDCPPVDNGRDAHSATAYLGKQATGEAVLAALPSLAQLSS